MFVLSADLWERAEVSISANCLAGPGAGAGAGSWWEWL